MAGNDGIRYELKVYGRDFLTFNEIVTVDMVYFKTYKMTMISLENKGTQYLLFVCEKRMKT